MTTLGTLFAISAILDLDLYQMDVKVAFLHGSLDEELYMLQPGGFLIPGKEHLVYKLRCSLYGPKQAPRLWYKKFDSSMLSNGFTQSKANPCLYKKKETNGSPIILVLYVDDMLIAGKHEITFQGIKCKLKSAFS